MERYFLILAAVRDEAASSDFNYFTIVGLGIFTVTGRHQTIAPFENVFDGHRLSNSHNYVRTGGDHSPAVISMITNNGARYFSTDSRGRVEKADKIIERAS